MTTAVYELMSRLLLPQQHDTRRTLTVDVEITGASNFKDLKTFNNGTNYAKWISKVCSYLRTSVMVLKSN